MIELILLGGLVLAAGVFAWSSARVWNEQRSAGRVLAPRTGTIHLPLARSIDIGSGGRGAGSGTAGGSGVTAGAERVVEPLGESGSARVKLPRQEAGRVSENASGLSR
ncbi:MAG TPA: hypothetical protein PK359_10460 [Burkholderiaceae bacterium]|nr:hypothetical protein [Burkholderiaceae bacterium]